MLGKEKDEVLLSYLWSSLAWSWSFIKQRIQGHPGKPHSHSTPHPHYPKFFRPLQSPQRPMAWIMFPPRALEDDITPLPLFPGRFEASASQCVCVCVCVCGQRWWLLSRSSLFKKKYWLRSWERKEEISNFSQNLWGGDRLEMVEGEDGTQEWGQYPGRGPGLKRQVS